MTNSTKYLFPFEEQFDTKRSRGWMIRNWPLSIVLATVYLLAIYVGQKIMTNKKPFQLRTPLMIWNFTLALFSFIAAFRLYPEFIHLLAQKGFIYTVCDHTTFETNRVTGFWLWLFILSKAPELFDTMFIILRKQKLVFLHWFHHSATLCFTWYIYQEHAAIGRWFAVLNLTVHSMMYAYFGLKSLKVPIPRVIAMFITTAQIVQMVLGALVSVCAYGVRLSGQPCDISQIGGFCAVLIYGVHFYLFVRLFTKLYLGKKLIKKE